MIEPVKISSYEYDDFSLEECWLFRGSKCSFVLSKQGSSIVLGNEKASKLESCSAPDDLRFKLHQRGFGESFGLANNAAMRHDVSPSLFMVDFTTRCNCNCAYCLRSFDSGGESIQKDRLSDICAFVIDYCVSHEIDSIAFQPWGGEPLLELDSILYSKKLFDAAGIKAHFTLQTNGLLLSLGTYEQLLESGISVGVSLDGPSFIHDVLRSDCAGRGTHGRIEKNIRDIMSRYGPDSLGVIAVVSSHTLSNLEACVDYLVRELRLRRFKLNLLHPNGPNFDNNLLVATGDIPSYIERLLSSLIALINSGYSCSESNIADKLENLLGVLNGDICHSRGCHAGRRFISFDQKGDIYPCEMIGRSDLTLGNIYSQSLNLDHAIQEACSSSSFYNPRTAGTACDECPYLCYCHGGCRASAISYGYEPGAVDRIECEVNRNLYPRLIELILNDPQVCNVLLGGRIRL